MVSSTHTECVFHLIGNATNATMLLTMMLMMMAKVDWRSRRRRFIESSRTLCGT